MLANQFRNRKKAVFEKNRSAIIHKLAQRNNYEYSREERPPRDWHQLHLFRQNRRLSKNKLRFIGPDHATNILDFGYQTKYKQKLWQSVVVIERYTGDFGRVMLTPVAVDTSKTSNTADGSQISSSYSITSSNEILAESLIQNEELRLCLERNRGWTIETFSLLTCFYRPEFVVDACAYLDYAASANELYEALHHSMQPIT